MSIITTLVPLILKIVEFFLMRAVNNHKAMDSFYSFVEKMNAGYMQSAEMRSKAQARLKSIKTKPFKETV